MNFPADPEWTERAHRQIIEAIQCIDTLDDLQTYWEAETIMLDGFYMNFPEYWELIKDAYDEQRIFLDPSTRLPKGNADPAEPGNSLGITF